MKIPTAAKIGVLLLSLYACGEGQISQQPTKSEEIKSKTTYENPLDELVESRKQEARDKHLYKRAKIIAHYLGEMEKNEGSFPLSFHSGSDEYSFRNDSFTITHTVNDVYLDKSDYLVVEHKGKVVFEEEIGTIDQHTSGRIPTPRKYMEVNGYIPGEWERDFERLYNQALELEKEEKQEEEQRIREQKRKELMNRFGIKESDIKGK